MFHRKNFFTASTVLLLCFVGASVHAMKMPTLKCLDQELDFKEYFKGWMECAEEFLSKEDAAILKDPKGPMDKKQEVGKKAHENMCIRACQWKKHQHVLKDDGTYDESHVASFVEKIFPEAARSGMKSGFKTCFEQHSKTFSNDDNCKGYKGFEDCLKKSYMDICKIDHCEMDGMQ